MRTFPTLAFDHIADAAFVRSCGGTLLATQRISPNQSFRVSKLDNSKLPLRCVRAQQSGGGQNGHRIRIVTCLLLELLGRFKEQRAKFCNIQDIQRSKIARMSIWRALPAFEQSLATFARSQSAISGFD